MLLVALLQSDPERWHEFATHQPGLAREIEQAANHIRAQLEEHHITPIEVQQKIINLATFIAASLTRARGRALEYRQHAQSETPPSTL